MSRVKLLRLDCIFWLVSVLSAIAISRALTPLGVIIIPISWLIFLIIVRIIRKNYRSEHSVKLDSFSLSVSFFILSFFIAHIISFSTTIGMMAAYTYCGGWLLSIMIAFFFELRTKRVKLLLTFPCSASDRTDRV